MGALKDSFLDAMKGVDKFMDNVSDSVEKAINNQNISNKVNEFNMQMADEFNKENPVHADASVEGGIGLSKCNDVGTLPPEMNNAVVEGGQVINKTHASNLPPTSSVGSGVTLSKPNVGNLPPVAHLNSSGVNLGKPTVDNVAPVSEVTNNDSALRNEVYEICNDLESLANRMLALSNKLKSLYK